MNLKIANLNFNSERLELVHGYPETEFMPLVLEKYPHAEFLPVPDGRQLIYVDNDSPILGIAHLDGTMPATHFAIGRHYSKPGHQCIFSPYVDDRLGAYTLLDLLPQLEINCDILLSVGEEIGNPTSQFFEPEKDYNWMFQFDRKGTDAVYYQYTEPEWLSALSNHFIDINRGIFSDIAFMDHLEVCGVNIGTGYYDYTWEHAWASLNDLVMQVNRFMDFYDEYHNTMFPYLTGDPEWWKEFLLEKL